MAQPVDFRKTIFLGLGEPYSGKSTTLGAIGLAFEIKHFSSGEMLRGEATVAAYQDAGLLIPDEVYLPTITASLSMYLHTQTNNPAIILDGAIRTSAQIEPIEKFLRQSGYENFIVLNFTGVNDGQLLDRMHTRIATNPVARKDDKPEVFTTRLQIFRKEKDALLTALGTANWKIVEVDAGPHPDTVFLNAISAMKEALQNPQPNTET